MSLKTSFALLGAKATGWLIKEYNLGSGSTWPGHIALKIDQKFIPHFLKNKNLKIVLVAGTNGKTTTSKLLGHILEKNQYKVFQNEEGANLLNGLATSIIKHTNRLGKIKQDIAIFEVDENNLPHIVKQITPDTVVLLNLFRDQLDRYGEVNTIAHNWLESLQKLPSSTQFIINADDPQLQFLGNQLQNVTFFGLSEKNMERTSLGHDVDSVYCPNCGTKLEYKKIAYSHLGDYDCPKCKFKRSTIQSIDTDAIHVPMAGIYNRYNTIAALLAAEEVFATPMQIAIDALQDFTPAFGRQETILYKKRNIIMLLSKNPTGFNQSIDAIIELAQGKKVNILLLLNDRIPDGKDVSWIWDTDIERLLPKTQSIVISGDRPYDMALRIKYASENQNAKVKSQNYISNVKIFEELKMAVNEIVDKTEKDESLYILPTYSAMLEARKILTGKSIL